MFWMSVCIMYAQLISFSLATYAESMLIVDAVPIVNSTALPSPTATDNVRLITVYLPAQAMHANNRKRFPTVYYLPGLGGTHASFTVGNKNLMDELIKENEIEPFIVVHVDPSLVTGIDVDGKRRYQGTWYVNSELNGNFEDFMINDLIPYVDTHYPTIPDASYRAVMGQSMGGFGSTYYGIKHPELFAGFAQASGTPFFLMTQPDVLLPTVAQSAPGHQMFTFNSFIIPEIPSNGPNSGKVTPDNGQFSFSIFSYAAAFSPNLSNPPYYVDLPFEVNDQWEPIFVTGDFFINSPINGAQINTGKSLVPRPDIIAKWQTFDPFLLLDSAVNTVSQQAIYQDGGSSEPLNAAGARTFSDKMASLGIDNEYLLYNGGHVTCLTSETCARHRTMFQCMSAQFARNKNLKKNTIKLVGQGSIVLKNNGQATITDNTVVGVQTDMPTDIHATQVSFDIQDNGYFAIGNSSQSAVGAVLQFGNSYSKAVFKQIASIETDTIDGALFVNGTGAHCIINNNSVLAIGATVNGNRLPTIKQAAFSSSTNLASFNFSVLNGTFTAQQGSSSAENSSAAIIIGQDANYRCTVNPEQSLLQGGCNMVLLHDCIARHPLALSTVGQQQPGGIRNNLNISQTIIDYFTKLPINSDSFYTNSIQAGLLTTASLMDNTIAQQNSPFNLNNASTAQELFEFLATTENDAYNNAGTMIKEATVGLVNGKAVIVYVDQGVIVRIPAEQVPLDHGQSIDFVKIAQTTGVVNIWIEEVDGQRTLIRVDEK